MNKNDKLTLKITAMSSDGMGIAKTDEGIAVFISGAAVGDVAEVIIVKVQKNYCFGKIVKIIEPSSDRITPSCSVFSQCGGCCYRHISYDAELKIKQQRVVDAIERIAKLKAPVLPIISANERENYRNKGQFPVGKNKDGDCVCGFYALHSHRIVPCLDCALQPPEFAPILNAIMQYIKANRIPTYDEQQHKGIIRHIYLRKTDSGDIMVCLVINADRLPKEMEKSLVLMLTEKFANVKTIVLNINKKQTGVILGQKCKVLFGEGYLVDTLCGIKVKISPQSFYQVNHDMAQKLYEIAAEYADVKNKTVLDLYCGAGTIGLSMAKQAKKIIGVEIVESAVKDAHKNADMNGIFNAEFICDNAANASKILSQNGVRPDVVILDPPRKGAEAGLVDTIANEFAPRAVVYVSCDPATLARDLAIFAEMGYEVQKIQPVDMFPCTAHVETVVLMSKTK